MKKLAALLLSVLMMPALALAEIAWPAPVSDGQRQLQSWVAATNETLLTIGGGQIDMLYELYRAFASLGMDGADVADKQVEMYVTLSDAEMVSLELRVSELSRFSPIASACIHAASPMGTSLEQAQTVVNAYVKTVQNNPKDSFEEPVNLLQGDQPRAYFAYYPDQYADGRNWLQMTLIFPHAGSTGGAFFVPATPPPPGEPAEDDLLGYFSDDNYNHFEYFTTPSPEPDSAAME